MKPFTLLLVVSLCFFGRVAAQQFQQEFGNPRKAFVEAIATPDHADSYYRLGQQAMLRVVAREGGVPLDGAGDVSRRDLRLRRL